MEDIADAASAMRSGPGLSHPLGATVFAAGANFSLFSRAATRVELMFFDRPDDARPSRTIELDPHRQRTYHYWHTFVGGVRAGHKHNQANGEDNRDGANDNRSWNCGVEGPTSDPAIEKLRNRQVKNFLSVTLLSLGVPMVLMGDEVRRTQAGNNNAYCRDNETSWFDWALLERHADVHRFMKLLAARRLQRDRCRGYPRLSLNRLIGEANKAWHGVRLNQPDWSDHSHSVAFTAELRNEHLLFHLILNAYWQPLDFELPALHQGDEHPWLRWIDTALETPEDIVPWEQAPTVPGLTYRADARSVVALYAHLDGET